MRSVNNKHNEFAESLRNIMRSQEKKKVKTTRKNYEKYGDETRSLQELLEAKYDELFGTVDNDNNQW